MTTATQAVIDWSEVRRQDFRFILIASIFFFLYGVILAVICSLQFSLIAGIIFVLIQLVIGLPASRLANSYGKKAKSKLVLQDPSLLDDSWTIHVDKTHNSDMKRIFEKFLKSIASADTKTSDDINDIAWFIVIVWAMISGLLYAVLEIGALICLVSNFVLIFVSLISYYNGHKGLVNGYFEDDLSHLEYYCQSRMSAFNKMDSLQSQQVIWKIKKGNKVLTDFSLSFEVESFSVIYHIGLPSEEYERFEITASEEDLNRLINSIEVRGLPPDWEIEKKGSSSLLLVNLNRRVDLKERSSFIEMPREPVYLIEMLEMIFYLISETQSE